MPASEEAAVEVDPNTMVTNNVVRYIRTDPNITLISLYDVNALQFQRNCQLVQVGQSNTQRVLDNAT